VTGESRPAAGARTTVVIATRDRRAQLLKTLERLTDLPERPAIVVVDNGSGDGTAAAVRDRAPAAELIELGENRGAAARNFGVAAARTEHVAFSDDDSWWRAGSLAAAEETFDEHPELALIAARVLIEPRLRTDPTCLAMAASPLDGRDGLPGPPVLGFVACGAVVRRSAFLSAGGFEPRLGIGGEEELLAIELAALGYELAYVESVVAVHEPAGGSRPGRTRRVLRNALLVAWLRRPAGDALRHSARLLTRHRGRREAAHAALGALSQAGWVARRRRAVPRPLARALRSLDGE